MADELTPLEISMAQYMLHDGLSEGTVARIMGCAPQLIAPLYKHTMMPAHLSNHNNSRDRYAQMKLRAALRAGIAERKAARLRGFALRQAGAATAATHRG